MFHKKFSFFLLCVLIFSIFSFSFVGAKDIIIENEKGLNILPPPQFYFKQNQDYNLSFHVNTVDSGYYVDNSSTNCYFTLFCDEGCIVENEKATFNNATSSKAWNVELNNSFNDLGTYHYTITCEDDLGKIGGSVSVGIEVTESGNEITKENNIIGMSLIFVMLFLITLSVYGFFRFEDYRGKFALFLVTYLLLISLSFGAWQLGYESVLEGIGLVEIFRLIFYILIIGLIPVVFLSFVWVIYTHIYSKELRNMLEKGMSPDEAVRRAGGFKGF